CRGGNSRPALARVAGRRHLHFPGLLDCLGRHLVHGSAFAGFCARLLRCLLVADRPQIGKAATPDLRPRPAEKTRCPSCLKRSLKSRLKICLRAKPLVPLRCPRNWNFLSSNAGLCSASRTRRFFPLWSAGLSRKRRLFRPSCRSRAGSSRLFIYAANFIANSAAKVIAKVIGNF